MVMQERFRLDGARAVVVGASQGIGAAIAVAYAASGAEVVLAGRDRERLAPVAGEVAEHGGGPVAMHEVDVADPDGVTAFAASVLDQHGPPTVIVNSANYGLSKPAIETSVEEWDAAHHVHLRGPFLTASAFLPAMAEVGYGKVVNLSSNWAVRAGRGRTVYGAAKAGLNHLTAVLAVEWAEYGVRVNGLAAAATRTPTVEERLRREPGRESYLVSGIPLGRIGTTDDLLGAAIYLASPASDFVTGQTLFVDGGMTAA
jgi:NAD(P)-dependent dehydrogenase (short-subunit alcohol dehydrogenase family)